MTPPTVPAIRIDPATGQKLFNTRARAAEALVEGGGYAVVTDDDHLALPAFKVDALFGEGERARYAEFNDVRRGTDDYVRFVGSVADYQADPHSAERVERDALDDGCEILVVGAGFAGLLLW